MNFLILIVKGFIIGLAKIIPGVSGAILAISMGIYEKAIYSISNFFKKPFENIKFLLPLVIGVFLAIVIGSKAVLFLINNFYLPTMLLFIGLIIGGMTNIFNKIKLKDLTKFQYLIMTICFSFVFLLSFVGKQNYFITSHNSFLDTIIFIIIGIIDAVTMVIPGISGTAVMMLLGLYDILLELLGSLTNFNTIIANLNLLIPYAIGIIATIFILSKIMNYLFNKKETTTYCGIIGFATSSVFMLFLDTLNKDYQLIEIIISLMMLLIGTLLARSK